MVIVDTTVWVDYFRGLQNPETDWLDIAADRQRLGLTDLILCEVLRRVTRREDALASANRPSAACAHLRDRDGALRPAEGRVSSNFPSATPTRIPTGLPFDVTTTAPCSS